MILSLLIALVGSLLASLFAADLTACMPALCTKLVKKAAALMQDEVRERCCEEWLSHIDQTPGTLPKLFEALGFFVLAKRSKWKWKGNLILRLSKLSVRSYKSELRYRYLILFRVKPLKRLVLSRPPSTNLSRLLDELSEIEANEYSFIDDMLKDRVEVFSIFKEVLKS